ncbi:hypothetical protein [Rubrivirga marina]|uniref:Uncharacterized protein n=1 Tax=Rubrivirga marina TaxID=1196024 RepID=A0A271J143_9BACT|nr:hypothetical protein [Rubrivirga marina]PAP77080.1 hypothetical protein BSZ37_11905 [Rubrivirga marina]
MNDLTCRLHAALGERRGADRWRGPEAAGEGRVERAFLEWYRGHLVPAVFEADTVLATRGLAAKAAGPSRDGGVLGTTVGVGTSHGGLFIGATGVVFSVDLGGVSVRLVPDRGRPPSSRREPRSGALLPGDRHVGLGDLDRSVADDAIVTAVRHHHALGGLTRHAFRL